MKQLKLKPTTNQTKKAFTIIEVVLVLAIAGLIFLMVFIALPALQRNQRDTQRKNDMSRLQTAIQNYQSNNRGSLPANYNTDFKNAYMLVGGDTFADPDGSAYAFYWGTRGTLPTDQKDSSGNTAIWLFYNAKCDGENTILGGGANKIAASMKLEGGGVYCVNN